MKLFRTTYSKYFTAYFCESCEKELSTSERMYNNGTCPHCGHRGKNVVSICKTNDYPARLKWTLLFGFIPVRCRMVWTEKK